MGKTYYSLGKETNSAGESQIHLRVYIARGNRLRISSGIWLYRKRWGKKNEINIPIIQGEEREDLLDKKSKLATLTELFEREIATSDDKDTLTRDWAEGLVRKFHKPVNAPKENVRNFFWATDEYLTKHKLSESRVKHFRVLVRSLKRFELYKRASGNPSYKLNLKTLSEDHLSQIEEFIANERDIFKLYPEIYDAIPYSTKQAIKTHKPRCKAKDGDNDSEKGRPKERGQNYTCDIMSRFRSFIIWANEKDYTTNNPFKNYSVGESVYGTPVYITNDERNKLYATDMYDNLTLATQRDIFVFQCLIGCRVSDLLKMTRNSVINGAIEYIARKTREDRPITVRVPLNSVALEIIARYESNERESLLPFISSQKYNEHIKKAFKVAGLDRMVTIVDQKTRGEVYKPLYEVASSHMARRTFIGNIYKKVKDPNLVGSLSGHKEGSKAFARYRDIDEEMKKELISFLD